MVAKGYSATLIGVDAAQVEIESQLMSALKRFTLVGLPDGVLKEAKDRIRCAIDNSGFSFPNSEVVVSLAPAALPKAGSAFDLPIALSILAAAGEIDRVSLAHYLIVGEVALDGRVKDVPGVLAAACLAARRRRFKGFIFPARATEVAQLAAGLPLFPVSSLAEAAAVIEGKIEPAAVDTSFVACASSMTQVSLADIRGQHSAKRVLEIAAAGAHNVLLSGPPGSGKSMLASRLPAILPPLSADEFVEVARVRNALPLTREASRLTNKRPFRAPHHSTSLTGLVGGGSPPRPGEISLAHRGVLFLDELPEFRRDALEALRQPLENRKIALARSTIQIELPADFILIAAMNPCPCGLAGVSGGGCTCPPGAARQYRRKLSGPLLDRFDLGVPVKRVPASELRCDSVEDDPTEAIRTRVEEARMRQRERGGETLNAQLSPKAASEHCRIPASAARLLEGALERLRLSARQYFRTLRVARTIADLEGESSIREEHVAEALTYRIQSEV